MEYFDTSKSLLENLYYLSGILVLVTIVIGLFQLSIAKKTLKTNSQREAASLAVKQINIYVTQIIPLQNKLNDVQKEKKISSIKIKIGEFTSEYLLQKIGEEEFYKGINERKQVIEEVLDVLNLMEAFSVYFIKEVADEEIAYSSIGATFVHSVENLYFDLSMLNVNKGESFQNLIKLYELWSEKKELNNLQKAKNIITNQIEKIKPTKIKPLGTK